MGHGTTPAIAAVETEAAALFGCDSALYFGSGYWGPAILLQGLSAHYDHIIVDADSHYAIMDAIAISQKPYSHFAHRDVNDLEKVLQQKLSPGQVPLLITDGVFPASGALAPLPDYQRLLQAYSGLLCIDDAHGFGVLGKNGRGSLDYWNVDGPNSYACGTLSKAFGGHGGLITGSKALIETLKQNSPLLNAASGVPTPIAAATAVALKLVANDPTIRQQLADNIAYTKAAFRVMGFDSIPDTPVPIICLGGQGLDLAALQRQLYQQGIAVQFIPAGAYTGVPEGGALRIALFSSHSREQLDGLLAAVKVSL